MKVLLPDPRGEGLCAQTDPELFYPEKGGTAREAKKICGECPARLPCLEYALLMNEEHGVWGATTREERDVIKRKRGIVGRQI